MSSKKKPVHVKIVQIIAYEGGVSGLGSDQKIYYWSLGGEWIGDWNET